jgi:1-pyrroline-5-carboxylate dehydrogenase
MITDTVLASRDFAGIHFTGSTHVFKDIWAKIGANIHHYKTYPRIVGETGGKDFYHRSLQATLNKYLQELLWCF